MKKELKKEIDRFNRIYDRYMCKNWGVRIVWKHNRRGGLEYYVIEKKKKGRRNSWASVKVHDHYWSIEELHFWTEEEAFERLDKTPVETMVIYDDINLIIK